MTLLLPGAALVHFGQQLGYTTKLPVQLGRFPIEVPNPDITNFYQSLMAFLSPEWEDLMDTGEWVLLDTTSPLISFLWRDSERILLGIWNYSAQFGNGKIHFPPDIPLFTEKDPTTEVTIFSEPFEVIHILDQGSSFIDVSLKPWQIHLIQIFPKEVPF